MPDFTDRESWQSSAVPVQAQAGGRGWKRSRSVKSSSDNGNPSLMAITSSAHRYCAPAGGGTSTNLPVCFLARKSLCAAAMSARG